MAIKTVRRDALKRLAEAGRLVLADSYHFDDQHGESRGNEPMPVAIKPADDKDRKSGTCYLFKHDFESSSGRAYENPNGTITLIVHSNSNYTFRVLPKGK